MTTATNAVTVSESLFYLSGAFKNAVDGRFLSQEHASALFKNILRGAGFELPTKTNGTPKDVEKKSE